MNDLISIIIPVYKVESYIHNCINSVINQTYSNLEIILVDDGSPDNCPQICDEYASIDSRIRVIHKSNGGLSDARNAGLDIATGEYIVFIDSDDQVSLDYIEYLYNMLKENPNSRLSVCGVMQIQQGQQISEDKHIEYQHLTPCQALENMLYAKGIEICSYAKMYHKSLFENLKFPKGKVYEDSATTYLLFEMSPEIVYGNKRCYYYFTRPGSISKFGAFNKNEYDYIEHTKIMLDYIIGKYPEIRKAVDRYCLYSKMRILRMLVYSKPRNKVFEKEVVRDIKKVRFSVLLDKNSPARDKMAIIMLLFGRDIYKICWFVYCKFTKRLVF